VQYCQRIGGPRLAVNRDEHPSPAGQHVENATVMCLKSDPPHRRRNTGFRQGLVAALESGDQRPARHRGAKVMDVDRVWCAKGALDKRRKLGRRFA
jgi:hypothetical protein